MKKLTLTQIGIKHGTDKANYHGFTDFYEKELAGKDIRLILEIGILGGASLRMWKEFYPDAIVIGVDMQEPLEIPNVICLNGDGTDIDFLIRQFDGMQFDLIIDDASHITSHQIKTFRHLFWKNLQQGGIYICEDVHTSFRGEYNDGPSAVEYFENLEYGTAKFWWKDPDDKTDSGTCLITK